MKLYEINAEIEELLAELEPDPETGEVTGDVDSVIERLEHLSLEKKSILEYLAKLVLNARAEAETIKAEEKRLRDRRQALERKDERLMRVLDRECAGQTTDCGVATVSYRKTVRVNVTDSNRAVLWLQNNHEDCIRYSEPEISKTEVKKLLVAGTEIPGVELVHDLSCSLR